MKETERVDVVEIRVPYRDVDMHGVMHAAAYLVHAEAALAHFWRFRPKIDDEPLFFVKKFECACHRALRFDELARFTVRIDKIGGRSVGFSVAVEFEATLCADIEITWMAAEPESREPAALPEDIRDWLYQFLP